MTKGTLIVFSAFFYLATPAAWAAQAEGQVRPPREGVMQFKNPFLPEMPKKKKIVKPKTPQAAIVKPVERKEEIVTPPVLSISGLVWNTDLPQAIVNDRIVGIGDAVEGATIVSIRRDEIEISYLGKTFKVGTHETLGPRQPGRTSEEIVPEFPQPENPPVVEILPTEEIVPTEQNR